MFQGPKFDIKWQEPNSYTFLGENKLFYNLTVHFFSHLIYPRYEALICLTELVIINDKL